MEKKPLTEQIAEIGAAGRKAGIQPAEPGNPSTLPAATKNDPDAEKLRSVVVEKPLPTKDAAQVSKPYTPNVPNITRTKGKGLTP